MMRFFPLFVAALTAAAAGAQSYPGEAVSVDYSATGTKVLLYPGGRYGRVVHPLKEPGEFTGPVTLHKPGKRAAVRAKPPRAAIRQATVAPVRETPPPARKSPPQRVAAVPPPPPIRSTPQAPAASNFGDLVLAKPPAKPPRMAQTPRPAAPAAPPKRVASIEPSRKVENAGVRRGTIGFEPNASDPSANAVQSIGKLADELNGTLIRGAARVQILAYAGPKGEKSSDSRRLSLKRALIVRQLLIDSGVPSDRIDVRAMGGADDAGAAERVDVFVKG